MNGNGLCRMVKQSQEEQVIDLPLSRLDNINSSSMKTALTGDRITNSKRLVGQTRVIHSTTH